ncbi:MAG: hypothetical protein LBT50_00790 [Prevotellaceae bacterium]|jgi:hypothetical protein|nr:hypothetical protein [Prevotellaceae bacterium]
MKNLLGKNFVSHYELTASITVNVVSTSDKQFDLKDDDALVYPFGNGIAKYENPTRKEVNVINYESFLKSLPQSFQQSKKNCDLIVYTTDKQYFLLNELTNTSKNKSKKQEKAILQMLQVLNDLLAVPSINEYIQQHKEKRCCFFNKNTSVARNYPTHTNQPHYLFIVDSKKWLIFAN